MKINLASLKSVTTLTVSLCPNNKLPCLKKVILPVTGSQEQWVQWAPLCPQVQMGFRSFFFTHGKISPTLAVRRLNSTNAHLSRKARLWRSHVVQSTQSSSERN